MAGLLTGSGLTLVECRRRIAGARRCVGLRTLSVRITGSDVENSEW